MPITYTPIRYPGGKTKIYPEVRAILQENGLVGCPYAEVFAGGAGLAIKLLLKGDVSSITINDYDRAVFCMWDAIVHRPDDMCAFIDGAVLDVPTWERHREVYRNRDSADALDLARSSFYLNRTNISGILGGGLIGGKAQKSKFKMDARFNRATLKRKVREIAQYEPYIDVTYLDAEKFIASRLTDVNTFAYFDPPYVQKGPGLYKSSYDADGHRSLAKAIAGCDCRWIVTYDADALIEEIYSDFQQNEMEIGYSANLKTIGKEKIILGPGLMWPKCLRS